MQRAWRSVELIALRLSLPTRLAREPLDALLASLTPPSQANASGGAGLASLGRDVLFAERGLARLPWVVSTCLYRAMARYALLRKMGVEASFVVGLGKGGAEATGHAWVELGGRPFEELEDVSRYTVTFRYPPAENDGKEVTS